MDFFLYHFKDKLLAVTRETMSMNFFSRHVVLFKLGGQLNWKWHSIFNLLCLRVGLNLLVHFVFSLSFRPFP